MHFKIWPSVTLRMQKEKSMVLSVKRRKQRASRKRSRLERQAEKQTQAAARQEQKKLKKPVSYTHLDVYKRQVQILF